VTPISLRADNVNAAPVVGLQALFVGSGIQRKGLHHLLLAWRRANLPAGSRLTIIARNLDSGLRALVSGTKGVLLRPGVSAEQLAIAYQTADVFVMPSLIEGFGQVYLEALSFGLPVVGSENTCLPDLGGEGDGIFISAAGDVGALASVLERFSRNHKSDATLRVRARKVADQFTWERFRAGIIEVAMRGRS